MRGRTSWPTSRIRSGLAVGALTGILLNAILPGKDFKFSETDPSIKDAERWGGVKPANGADASVAP